MSRTTLPLAWGTSPPNFRSWLPCATSTWSKYAERFDDLNHCSVHPQVELETVAFGILLYSPGLGEEVTRKAWRRTTWGLRRAGTPLTHWPVRKRRCVFRTISKFRLGSTVATLPTAKLRFERSSAIHCHNRWHVRAESQFRTRLDFDGATDGSISLCGHSGMPEQQTLTVSVIGIELDSCLIWIQVCSLERQLKSRLKLSSIEPRMDSLRSRRKSTPASSKT